jgi:glycosyltransferase 2 family protein
VVIFRRSSRWLLLFSSLVACGAGLLAVTHPEQVRAFAHTLARLSPLSIALAFSLILAQVSAQALRMWAIIPRDTPLTVIRAGYIFTVGDWTNIFVPARGGDALKVVLMTRGETDRPMSLTRAAGAMLADKVVDIGTLFLLCAAAGLMSVVLAKTRAALPPPSVTFAVIVALVLLMTWLRYQPPRWVAARMGGVRELAGGLSALRSPVWCVTSVLCSVTARASEVFALAVLCRAVGVALTLPQVFLALVIVNLSVTVPVSVANLGMYEAGLAFGLTRAGMPLPLAITVATTHHVLELLGLSLSAAGYAFASRWQPRPGIVHAGARDATPVYPDIAP